ncbi:MAG: hypothetical protein QXS38_00650 [Candidatus Pacearchaeota archaeon]
MGQKIIVKVVFNSTREAWENFGNNRYLLRLSYPEDSGATAVVKEYISRQIGVPASKIAYLGQDIRKNWMFEVL